MYMHSERALPGLHHISNDSNDIKADIDAYIGDIRVQILRTSAKDELDQLFSSDSVTNFYGVLSASPFLRCSWDFACGRFERIGRLRLLRRRSFPSNRKSRQFAILLVGSEVATEACSLRRFTMFRELAWNQYTARAEVEGRGFMAGNFSDDEGNSKGKSLEEYSKVKREGKEMHRSGSRPQLDLSGAAIQSNSEERNPTILLPNQSDDISHLALDIGGSLIKLIYFSRHEELSQDDKRRRFMKKRLGIFNGKRRSCPILGGRLHFVKFETGKLNECLDFISSKQLHLGGIDSPSWTSGAQYNGNIIIKDIIYTESFHFPAPANVQWIIRSNYSCLLVAGVAAAAALNSRWRYLGVPTVDYGSCRVHYNLLPSPKPGKLFRKSGKPEIKFTKKATGGGAYKYADDFKERLGVSLDKEDEMNCLVAGANFLLKKKSLHVRIEITPRKKEPRIVVLGEVAGVAEYVGSSGDDPRQYDMKLLLTWRPEGVDGDGKFQRVSGTNVGGFTWYMGPGKTVNKVPELSQKGDSSNIDMLVGDIYGGLDYSKRGCVECDWPFSIYHCVKFGKTISTSKELLDYSPEDISLSLLRMISYNIGQVQRTGKAMFLRHEGFLGALGAFMSYEKHGLDDLMAHQLVERFPMGAPYVGGKIHGPTLGDLNEKARKLF
ncbi:hypothetical protein IEQ34_003373 [Dendrobium chrysotoxum]|uniref:Pantothenate kinase n=1 Tax=Dendrobium chrysotoxum TaxID=161865 RepID=A0AAV7HJK0_DENCH|nr:hypothetical protein IEQ34_003373 [Dendrobium chrysotoxum]